MLDNTKIFDKDTHGHFDFLEDEIDCAIAGDIKFDQVLDELEKINPTTDSNIELDHIDDVIDPTVDYSESMPDVDSVSIDADTLIDAEREINFNPLDEDELIETVMDVDFIGDRGIANKLFYDNSEENDLLEEETEYNANTYNAILLEALSEKWKKRLKVGAAVTGAAALGYGAYKLNQHLKNNNNNSSSSSNTQKSIDNSNPERKLLTAPKQIEAPRKNPSIDNPSPERKLLTAPKKDLPTEKPVEHKNLPREKESVEKEQHRRAMEKANEKYKERELAREKRELELRRRANASVEHKNLPAEKPVEQKREEPKSQPKRNGSTSSKEQEHQNRLDKLTNWAKNAKSPIMRRAARNQLERLGVTINDNESNKPSNATSNPNSAKSNTGLQKLGWGKRIKSNKERLVLTGESYYDEDDYDPIYEEDMFNNDLW